MSPCAMNAADLPEPGFRTTVVSTFEQCCAKPHGSSTLTPTTSGNRFGSDSIKPKHAGSVCSLSIVNHLGVVIEGYLSLSHFRCAASVVSSVKLRTIHSWPD